MHLKPRLEDAATLRSGVQSGAIMRNQGQSGAIMRNQGQSGAIRRNQGQLECRSDPITDQSRTCVGVSGATPARF